MATGALLNAYIYGDSHDFSGDSNETSLKCEAVQLARSTWRSGGWTDLANGLKSSTLHSAGFGQAGADSSDAWTFTNLGAENKVFTVGPDETEGSLACLSQGMGYNFQVGGKVGELWPFALDAAGSDRRGVVRGRLLSEMRTVSATGAIGTPLQLGAVSSIQSVFSTIHLFGTAGTSITVVVESAAANTFSGATTRITHGSHTTVGGRWGTPVAGSITDTWWRARVSAISGTWVVAVAAGIQ